MYTDEKKQGMSVLDKVRLVVYRVHEKGLEIFLVNAEEDIREEMLSIPEGEDAQSFIESVDKSGLKLIQLEPVTNQDGSKVSAFAIEGDWHDIPSIKALFQNDVENLVKSKIVEMMPSTDSGAFVLIKDAFKKVLPYEYSMLKELKEILTEKNTIQNI
ncbi:MAG: hypothetical protein EA411_12410 [Saprospirales bacterium]|nr:MAG: hypothetical protein EA411_12410 [Saprospirales bacterium]